MTDSLTIFGSDYTGVTGIKAAGTGNGTLTYIRPTGTKSISSNGTGIDVTDYAAVDVSVSSSPNLQAKTNISPTTSSQTIQADSGYDGLSSVQVNAMPSGSVSASATKGSVSNHAISVTPTATVGTAGYLAAGSTNGTAVSVSASELVSGTYSVTSSGTKDVTNYASASVPAGSVSASAAKGTVSNHSVSVTPTATVGTAGYLAAGSANGTAVSVSASELVSGTYSVTSSGTKDVTNYASASVPAASNHRVTIDESFVTQSNARKWKLDVSSYEENAGWVESLTTLGSDSYLYSAVPSGTTITPTTSAQTIGGASYMMEGAVTVSAIPSQYIVPTGNKEITSNGTGIDVAQYSTVSVNVSGGGSSDVAVDTIGDPTSGTSTTLTFSNLKGEPTSFFVMADEPLTPGATAYIAAIAYDGTSYHAQTITNTSNAQVTYINTGLSHSYSNGTLTVTSTGTAINTTIPYALTYTYGGTSGNINTSDMQVGSGATSITFTGLEDEPLYWSCIFKSNFSTSSGYQRVICVRNNATNIAGLEMDSSAKVSALHWSASYSNGSLTITSNGTNQGGYFHQPGYYQLTYAIAGGGGNYQSKTVTPTTSQQVVEPDAGYEALSQVTVNAIPSTYVQPTSTVGSTTYRASTSNQTINAGTYHSAAATIAAVSQTNLSAENIKSGTTVSISNGSTNLWSVTGTYTGGGGSATVATATATASGRPTSLSFTVSGQPKAFFVRCTSAMSRSSNSTYYYVACMRYNGTNVTGNCWRMSNGNWTNITSGYSQSYSNGTLTVSSSGTSTTSPGSFYNNGSYECVYVY